MRQLFHKQRAFARERRVVSIKDAGEFAQSNYFRFKTEAPLIKITKSIICKIIVATPGIKVNANDPWLLRAVIDSPLIRESTEKYYHGRLKQMKHNMMAVLFFGVAGAYCAKYLPPGAKEALAGVLPFIFPSGNHAHLTEIDKAVNSTITSGIISAAFVTLCFLAYYVIKVTTFAKSLQSQIGALVHAHSD